MFLIIALFFLTIGIAFAVGGGGGGSPGGGSSSSSSSGGSGCGGICELECVDNGAVKFLAADVIHNITATGPAGENFTVTGYWNFNRFTSDEILFNKNGRYAINGYSVDCPGLKFSCFLAAITIEKCTNHDGYVEANFTARNFDSMDKMKYEFFAGSKSFYYTTPLKSAQITSFVLANTSNGAYFINASINENIGKIQISDTRCSSKTVTECVPPTSRGTPTSRAFLCYEMNLMKERVKCRLALTEEQRYHELKLQYLPEECRALNGTERDVCIQTYESVQKCWKYSEGDARVECVKSVINFTTIDEEKEKCEAAADKTTCHEKIKKNAFTLIKFRFYDLEERAEELHEKNPELVAEAVTQLEEKKREFNAAKTIGEKKQIVMAVRQIWKDFAAEVKT